MGIQVYYADFGHIEPKFGKRGRWSRPSPIRSLRDTTGNERFRDHPPFLRCWRLSPGTAG